MSDTRRPGFVSQVVDGAEISQFADVLQAWIAEALDISPDKVFPAWQEDKKKAPDRLIDWAVFSIENLKSKGSFSEGQTDTEERIRYAWTLDVTVRLYGGNVRSNALLLCDTFSINQHVDILHEKLGLGFIDCELQGPALEPVGNTFRQFADVIISFNYSYTRLWSVLTILSANPILHVNR